jgi:hypothetical protein
VIRIVRFAAKKGIKETNMYVKFFCCLITITSILFVYLSLLHIGDNETNRSNGKELINVIRDERKPTSPKLSNIATAELLNVDLKSENENEKLDILSPLKINTLYGKQISKFAYVTLIHGIDNTFSYRGFLYNVLIMRKSLLTLGSTADFIVMLGFTTLGDKIIMMIYT